MYLRGSLMRVCVVILAMTSVGLAADLVVFECNFESGICPVEISGAGGVVSSQGYSSYGCGNFLLHNDTGGGTEPSDPPEDPGIPTVLILTDLPPHASIAIYFDLAVIDSWDGSEEYWGDDFFNVAVDGQAVFRETISNFVHYPQTFVPAPAVVRGEALFDVSDTEYDIDSLYPIVEYVSHSDSTLIISFWADGDGWQGGADESWGIDNIKIIVSSPSDFVTGGGWIAQPAPALPTFRGNYYNLADAPGIDWADAFIWAEGLSQGVMGEAWGHLVTITSQDEQDFLYETFGSGLDEKWYGGFQDPDQVDPATGWQWVTGEPWDYTNWAAGEPNDGEDPEEDEEEQYLMGWNEGTAWNDGNGPTDLGGFVVEFEGADLLTGKANFAFNAKYKKGDSIPTGQAEFQFHAGDVNFHSTGYDWLYTGTSQARLKGTGTVNGADGYQFTIWATDGDPDTFRIKIWEDDGFGGEIVLYDTKSEQPLGGGSIVIHGK